MRRPRRGSLWLAAPLLLLSAAPWEASAVTLGKRDSLDSLDLGWGREDDYYRKSDGLYCKKCPAGTYLTKECEEQRGSSTCEPCGLGEYMEYPNALLSCQECSKCKEDQVELSPCQPQRNTVCACSNGTFCPPEHPCEMCQKCQPRCPKGQVMLKPCTPYSDLQCGPYTAAFPSYLKALTGIVAIAVIVTGIAVCCWKCRCSSPGDGRPSCKNPLETVKMLWCKTENVGTEDNNANTETERDRAAERQEMLPSRSERPWRTLVPAPETEPSQVLKSYFYTFGRKVPRDDWKRFGHSLNLEDNDITTGKTLDDFYDMMRRWQNREGSKASVNTLLDTLERLSLGGVAEDICDTLVREGRFQYETS
ncbi:tumor necrosis factor receptor superfamily member 10B-like isoform X1 [Camarhynchus parvulus]|uniref:tumor necrosis factor receptor superfamily member 10B-like isoform X1 n=1 Tax=Geospiza parvula TaxID=87175 RepID=UPI001237F11C|nr:tumor necrosis factor receptor superfamily member 10B-like isoform X1 [Camarhynchus parvulus]